MPECFKEEIARSWERCRQAGLGREGGFCQTHPLYSPPAGGSRRRLMEIAMPLLETLFYTVNEYRFLLALTDERGILLDYRCNPVSEQGLVEMNFQIGVSVAEEDVGTNGMGTAIAADKPMMVYGDEHYCLTHQAWVTFGVPVHDETGALIGCIGCSEYRDFIHAHTLGMLMALARAIEDQLRLEKALQDIDLHSRLRDRIIDSISEGLIYFGNNGRIREMNHIARDMLGYADPSGVRLTDIFSRDLLGIVGGEGGAILDEEMNLRTNRGRIRCFVTVTPVEDRPGELIGVVTILKKPSAVHSLANRVAGAHARYRFSDIIGTDPHLLRTLNLARSAARSPSNILLQGESGTGKELVAQAIHNASDRHSGPFIAINCSAVPKELLESELFGYEEGTFTGALKGGKPGKFELAHGGTVLLDEIGDMPLNMQAALLRVIQEKSITRLGSAKSIPVDTRVIASSNRGIHRMVRRGAFREDLFYRLNVVNLLLPPLRERKGDLPLLVSYFIEKMNQKLNKAIQGITPACMDRLRGYAWPGNIRELENIIEYSVNFCEESLIDERYLPDELREGQDREIAPRRAEPEYVSLEQIEKRHIHSVLEAVDGNKARASRILGIDRGTLYNKLRKHGPSPEVSDN